MERLTEADKLGGYKIKGIKTDDLTSRVDTMLVENAIDKLAAYEDTEEQGKWIKCNDRLPETQINVLCFSLLHSFVIAHVHKDGGWECDKTHCWLEPTHWMPLPDPPSEKFE